MASVGKIAFHRECPSGEGSDYLRRRQRCTLIDVETRLKETRRVGRGTALALTGVFGIAAVFCQPLLSQERNPAVAAGPPPSSGGFFPLSEVRKGMTAVAWTVFQGSKPEPMDVEILGVLRGARGPGQDMILAQLHGTKPEYTGVVAGMSGSPVYIGKRLLGSLSYRIGQFSKDPIAGITPIEQMLEVRGLPMEGNTSEGQNSTAPLPFPRPETTAEAQGGGMSFQAMETPLVMSGFRPEAIRLWQQQVVGTGLDMVSAGGASASSGSVGLAEAPSSAAAASIVPGSAVSAQLVRGDVEIAATCTVTYVDPKQLLACGHPILQAGSISLPMTTTEVVATLASPLNAFKIVNTGELIGSFTEDRDSAIRGVFGQEPRMIPVHISIHRAAGAGDGSAAASRRLNVEILDLPSLTAQALLVSLYQALLQNNDSSAETSYHLTGTIELGAYGPVPLDEWASASDSASAPLELALLVGGRFAKIYSSASRRSQIGSVSLEIEEVPRRVGVELENARFVSSDIVHAGDTVTVEATVRPWRQPARNIRIPVTLPARLGSGNIRVLVSDAGTLDRTLEQPKFSTRPADLNAAIAQAKEKHASDRIYVSLLIPETQAGVGGQTLTGLPLSMANALEPLHTAQEVNLNGESAELASETSAGGVLSGFQVLNLRIEPGGGLN